MSTQAPRLKLRLRRPLYGLIVISYCLLGTSSVRAEREFAASADAFVDSIGICTHITTAVGPYSEAHIANVYAALAELGVRHIRADVHSGTLYPSRSDYLYTTYGIGSNMIVNKNLELSLSAQAQIFLTHDSIESMEGVNEPDNFATSYTDLLGVAHTDSISGNIYDATRAVQYDFDSYLGATTKAFLSPAMMDPVRIQFLAPIPADGNAIHCYPLGRLPTGYGFTNSVIGEAKKLSSVSPLIVTESGYHTATQYTGAHAYVSETAMGKYIPRMLVEYFNRGIKRTYTYELMDGGNDASGTNLADKEENFGLLRYNFSHKPAFDVERNLINLLKEATWNPASKKWEGVRATFAPGALDYTLSGAPSTVHHLLLQKSDGTFYLILWQEVMSYNVNVTPHVDIVNATVPVQLTLNTAIRQADVYQPDVSTLSSATYANPSTITLNVPDQLLIVKLVPNTVPRPWTDIDIGPVQTVGSAKMVGGSYAGFRGDYFEDENLTTLKLSRLDPSINFSWGSTPPIPSNTSFGIRWTGQVVPQYSENYTFTTQCDSGVVLSVNGTKVINSWGYGGPGGLLSGTPIALVAGQKYDIQMDTRHAASWSYGNLGWSSPSTTSAAIPLANAWSIAGSGYNIWSADSFHYTYQPFNGDGQIIARVVSMPDAYSTSKAGIMIRLDMTTDSPYVALLVTPTLGVRFQYRATKGAVSTDAMLAGVTAPSWVKLIRSGNAFSAYSSVDGVTWTQVGSSQTISLSTNLYAGMSVCSRGTNAITANFDSLFISYPTVSIKATTPRANENPLTSAAFTVARTGTTASPLAVSYSVAGTAINGTDYATLTGAVTIPAGSSTASIAITPVNDTTIEDDETVQLSINSGSLYNVGVPASDTVKIISEDVVDDFESGSLSNWSCQSDSGISIETINVDTGTRAMKWVYSDNDINSFNNNISRSFATQQNWSNASKLVIRLAEKSGNPSGDLGKTLYFDFYNNGVRVTGGWGADVVTLDGTTTYRTVEFDLSNLPRDKVTSFFFYARGSVMSLGTHTWYIDNISLSTTGMSNASAVVPPGLISAVSRRVHGTGGNIDIPVSVVSGVVGAMSPPVECRSGSTETIVVTFNKAIQSAQASIASGTATVSAVPAINGTTATITLTGVSNAQTVRVNLYNITATDGGLLPNAVVSLRVLTGDVDANGAVNTTDVSVLQTSYGTSVGKTGFNPRADLDQNGLINTSDITLIQANYGTQAP